MTEQQIKINAAIGNLTQAITTCKEAGIVLVAQYWNDDFVHPMDDPEYDESGNTPVLVFKADNENCMELNYVGDFE